MGHQYNGVNAPTNWKAMNKGPWTKAIFQQIKNCYAYDMTIEIADEEIYDEENHDAEIHEEEIHDNLIIHSKTLVN